MAEETITTLEEMNNEQYIAAIEEIYYIAKGQEVL